MALSSDRLNELIKYYSGKENRGELVGALQRQLDEALARERNDEAFTNALAQGNGAAYLAKQNSPFYEKPNYDFNYKPAIQEKPSIQEKTIENLGLVPENLQERFYAAAEQARRAEEAAKARSYSTQKYWKDDTGDIPFEQQERAPQTHEKFTYGFDEAVPNESNVIDGGESNVVDGGERDDSDVREPSYIYPDASGGGYTVKVAEAISPEELYANSSDADALIALIDNGVERMTDDQLEMASQLSKQMPYGREYGAKKLKLASVGEEIRRRETLRGAALHRKEQDEKEAERKRKLLEKEANRPQGSRATWGSY